MNRVSFIAALAASLALGACASGPPPASETYDGMPPERYRASTTATKLTFAHRDRIGSLCASSGLAAIEGRDTRACALVSVSQGRREIIASDPCDGLGSYAKQVCAIVRSSDACSASDSYSPVVTCVSLALPNPCEFQGRYAQDLCHEYGHLNGWSGRHGA